MMTKNTVIFTAHLGALHVKGWQLQALGLLLEGGPKVKVNGPHPKVTSKVLMISQNCQLADLNEDRIE